MSIYTAESIAIRQALMLVKTKKWNNVIIFSDSLSVLRHLSHVGPCLTEDWYITTIKYQIRQLIATGLKIKLVWIPSHSGILHNECVDNFSKRFN